MREPSEMAEELVELRTVVNELEAGVIRAVLTEAGIFSSQHTANGLFLGAFGANPFNPTTVRVRRDDVQRAEDVLAANRKDSVDIDWDEVDVGEPEDRVAAGGEGVVRVSRRRKRVVRGVGLAVVMLLLIAPVVGAAVGTVLMFTPLAGHAAMVGAVAGLAAAIVATVATVRSRRSGRHDADVFETRE
jgi:hypothetical protein